MVGVWIFSGTADDVSYMNDFHTRASRVECLNMKVNCRIFSSFFFFFFFFGGGGGREHVYLIHKIIFI